MSISPHDRKNLKFGKRGLAAGFACSEAENSGHVSE